MVCYDRTIFVYLESEGAKKIEETLFMDSAHCVAVK